MEGLFQLKDKFLTDFGLIKTNAPEETLENLWQAYQNHGLDDLTFSEQESIGYPEELSTEGFELLLEMKGYNAERVFLTEILDNH